MAPTARSAPLEDFEPFAGRQKHPFARESGQHSIIQRETVDAAVGKEFTFSCAVCPDAKAYPGGSRPNMKTSSGGRTCRNFACTKYKKPEPVKSEVKPEAKATTPKPRSRPGRAPKHYLDPLRNLEKVEEKEAKRIKTEAAADLLPVELNIECVQHVIASYEETGETAEEAAETAE